MSGYAYLTSSPLIIKKEFCHELFNSVLYTYCFFSALPTPEKKPEDELKARVMMLLACKKDYESDKISAKGYAYCIDQQFKYVEEPVKSNLAVYFVSNLSKYHIVHDNGNCIVR